MERGLAPADLPVLDPISASPADSLVFCRWLLGEQDGDAISGEEASWKRWGSLIQRAQADEFVSLIHSLRREAALLAEHGLALSPALTRVQARIAALAHDARDTRPAAPSAIRILMDLQGTVMATVAGAYEHRHAQAGPSDVERHLAARVAWLAALQKINSVANSSLDLPEVLSHTAEAVAEVTHADVCSIYLYEEPAGRLVLRATHGLNPGAVGDLSLSVGEGMAGWAAEEGRPVTTRDGWQDPRFKVVPGLDEEPYHGMLSVPIILFTVNKLIGVLTIQVKEVRGFTEEETAFVETVAGQIAIAIENARLYGLTDERLREKVTQLSTLQRVTASLASSHDRTEVLDMIARHAVSITGADMSAIFELDETTRELKIVAHYGLSEAYLDIRVHEGEGAIGLAVQSRQPIVIADAQADPRLRTLARWVAEEGYRSLFSVPLVSRDRVLGGISVYTRAQHRFSRDQIDLLFTFANDAALAIENAQLYDEMRREHAAKSVLLQELNHRVKNNLQMMASLLQLQLRRVRSPEVRETLALTRARIESMAAVHDLLAQKKVGWTTIGEMAKKITEIASATFSSRPQRVSIEVHEAEVPIGPNHATLLALVLNELVCNSLTHGLQQRQRGMVVVDANERNGTVELCVADDGEGLPEGFSLERNAGLGLSIIQRLVQEQLGGGFRLENAAAVGHPTKTGTGTCALVSFPFDG